MSCPKTIGWPLALTAREGFLLLLALNALNHPADMPFNSERATLQAKLRVLLPVAQLGAQKTAPEKLPLGYRSATSARLSWKTWSAR